MSGKEIKNLTKTGCWQFITEKPTKDDLLLSCAMRIADSTETMAQNYVKLQTDAEYYKAEYLRERSLRESLQRSISAHKANYTRLKNKLNK